MKNSEFFKLIGSRKFSCGPSVTYFSQRRSVDRASIQSKIFEVLNEVEVDLTWPYAKYTSRGEFSFSQIAMLLQCFELIYLIYVLPILFCCARELIGARKTKNYEPSAVVTRTIFS